MGCAWSQIPAMKERLRGITVIPLRTRTPGEINRPLKRQTSVLAPLYVWYELQPQHRFWFSPSPRPSPQRGEGESKRWRVFYPFSPKGRGGKQAVASFLSLLPKGEREKASGGEFFYSLSLRERVRVRGNRNAVGEVSPGLKARPWFRLQSSIKNQIAPPPVFIPKE
ncbi:hypothetical protein VW41_05185 [Klebsiella michiganensis]|nr:hypothetical protein VW41_05185 [Klebsiella michiganensis]